MRINPQTTARTQSCNLNITRAPIDYSGYCLDAVLAIPTGASVSASLPITHLHFTTRS